MPNTVHFSLSKDGRTAFVAVKIGSTGKRVEIEVDLSQSAGKANALEVEFNDEGLALALRQTANLDVEFRTPVHLWGAVFLHDQGQLSSPADEIERGRVRDIQEVLDEHESDRDD